MKLPFIWLTYNDETRKVVMVNANAIVSLESNFDQTVTWVQLTVPGHASLTVTETVAEILQKIRQA